MRRLVVRLQPGVVKDEQVIRANAQDEVDREDVQLGDELYAEDCAVDEECAGHRHQDLDHAKASPATTSELSRKTHQAPECASSGRIACE